MNMYKLEKEIAFNEKNSFIYSKNDSSRREYLLRMKQTYPIKENNCGYIVILAEDFSLNGSKEYIKLSICENIIRSIKKNVDNKKYKELSEKFKKLFIREETNKEEILEIINDSKKEIETNNKSTIIPFMDIDSLITFIRNELNLNERVSFSIILNCNNNIIEKDQKNINDLMTEKFYNKITIKVATEFCNWKTYQTNKNEILNDYNVIEFDNDYQNSKKKVR